VSNKVLVVYNTCGIKRDNTDWYIECIESILNQNMANEDYRVVWSACLNSRACVDKVYSHFRDKISYCFHSEPYTVNITFNKAVKDDVASFGEFDSYLYVDSGCTFGDQDFFLEKMYQTFKSGQYSMVTAQSDTDEALNVLGEQFVYQSPEVQICDNDYIIPIGKAVNVHAHLYSNEIFKKFDEKLCPDIFAAFCTESTFSYVCAATNGQWVIMKDYQLTHKASIDGASSGFSHYSNEHGNTWNNLLFGRDARDFIKDPVAQQSGLGYEECNSVMNHDPAMYESGFCKNPEQLADQVKKHFYSNNTELNYEEIKSLFVK
jgi:hypothetical protein